MARAVYLRVLDRVERIGFDVLGRRAGLAPWEVGPAAVRSLVAADDRSRHETGRARAPRSTGPAPTC